MKVGKSCHLEWAVKCPQQLAGNVTHLISDKEGDNSMWCPTIHFALIFLRRGLLVLSERCFGLINDSTQFVGKAIVMV